MRAAWHLVGWRRAALLIVTVGVISTLLMQSIEFKWWGSWSQTQASFTSTWAITGGLIALAAAFASGRTRSVGLRLLHHAAVRSPVRLASERVVVMSGVAIVALLLAWVPAVVRTSMIATAGSIRPTFVLLAVAFAVACSAMGHLLGALLPRIIAPFVALVAPYVLYGAVAYASYPNPLDYVTPFDMGVQAHYERAWWFEASQCVATLVLAAALLVAAVRRFKVAMVLLVGAALCAVPMLLSPGDQSRISPQLTRAVCSPVTQVGQACLTAENAYALSQVTHALAAIDATAPGLLADTQFVQQDVDAATLPKTLHLMRRPLGLANQGHTNASQLNPPEFMSSVLQDIVPQCLTPHSQEALPKASANDVFARWLFQRLGVSTTFVTGPGPVYDDGDNIDFSGTEASQRWLDSASPAEMRAWVTKHRAEIAQCTLSFDAFADS